MPSILEAFGQQLTGSSLQNLAASLGANQEQTTSAVAAALPMLLAGLSHQATQAGGAQNLMSMLDRDGDGSILDDVAGYFASGGRGAAGAGPLGEIFGGRSDSVGSAISRASGLGSAQVQQLLAMLLPVVLSFLTRARSGAAPGAASTGGGLGDLLGDLLGGGGGGLGGLLGGDSSGSGGGLGDLLGAALGGDAAPAARGGSSAGEVLGGSGGGLGDLLGAALGGGSAPAGARTRSAGDLLGDDAGLDDLARMGNQVLGGLLGSR